MASIGIFFGTLVKLWFEQFINVVPTEHWQSVGHSYFGSSSSKSTKIISSVVVLIILVVVVVGFFVVGSV